MNINNRIYKIIKMRFIIFQILKINLSNTLLVAIEPPNLKKLSVADLFISRDVQKSAGSKSLAAAADL